MEDPVSPSASKSNRRRRMVPSYHCSQIFILTVLSPESFSLFVRKEEKATRWEANKYVRRLVPASPPKANHLPGSGSQPLPSPLLPRGKVVAETPIVRTCDPITPRARFFFFFPAVNFIITSLRLSAPHFLPPHGPLSPPPQQ